MSVPAEYHFHELEKLLGDYGLTPNMPCFHCHEPEAADICVAFAKFGAAARQTTTQHDAQARCPVRF
jgi:hypothetical protein